MNFLSYKYIYLVFIVLVFNSTLECGNLKKAFITGVSGQDGSYLAELLLNKNYEVHGLVRRSSTNNNIERLCEVLKDKNFFLHYCDITDANSIFNLIKIEQPDEIYNLAALSHVGMSFDIPAYTLNVNTAGVFNILCAIKSAGLSNKTRFYQASTSELFGKVQEIPQNELTKFYPRSPYAISKLAGYWAVVNYREAYNIFACNGILFNHESPRRGDDFVTRKITLAVSAIKHGSKNVLSLGNLDARRDWGHAKDYVEAMWLMLQQNTPEDYVISTGIAHSVREFVELAFKEVGINILWQGTDINEVGINMDTNEILVRVDSKFFRPTEVDFLLGNNSKARSCLGWKPKISFEELVKDMVASDLQTYAKLKG